MKKLPRIGAHVSIAQGIWNAPERARAIGCETFQCFTRSPQGGPPPPLSQETLQKFREAMKEQGMDRFVVHAPYIINLASPSGKIRHSSISILRQELERSSTLGASYVMAHPGSHADQPLEDGIERVVDSLREILDGYQGDTQFLIEISAGAGSVLGDTFQEVGDMLRPVSSLPGFGGVCFDTCHAFASGYDFRTLETARKTLAEFDTHIGLKLLKLTHVNDSKVDLAGKRDRHEHIGDGYIGESGLGVLLGEHPFSSIDWILETEDEGRERDVAALQKIRETS